MRTLVLMILVVWLLAAAPSPTTAPLHPEQMEPLVDGAIRYLPPAGWELISKNENGLGASYKTPDDSAMLAIAVTPQERAMQETARDQMALIIGKGIRDAAAKEGRELVLQPRVEVDDRFFLKIRDAMKTPDGKIHDRVQAYRLMGLNLVHVAATATVDSLEQSRPTHEMAERLLDTMRLSRGSKRMVYPKAQLRAIVPLDWKDTKTDQANGLVATYSDPKAPARQIILRARILPKEARAAGPNQTNFLDRMVDEERRTAPFLGSDKPDEEPPGAGQPPVLRVANWSIKRGDAQTLKVQTRYIIVGDVLASVRAVAEENDVAAMTPIFERFVANLKPIKDSAPRSP